MAGMSARPGSDAHRSQVGREAWLRLAACAAAAALLQMDGTIVTVALPSVGRELDVGSHTASWVLTAYFVAYGLTLFPGGSLVDRIGSRRVGLLGLAIFAAGAVIGALAGRFGVLVASRIVQGLGAGLVSPASLAGAVSGFPPERRGSALGLWGASSGMANLVGPLVGGLLTVAIDWRACWWFFVPAAAAVAWGVRRFVPPAVHADESPDAAGLRQRVVAAAALVATLTFVVMIGAFYLAQQYLQFAAGYSALGAAAALTVIALLVGLAAPLAGALSDRRGEGPTLVAGFALTALALAVLGIPGIPLHGPGALPLLVPFGLGVGLLFVPASRAALNAVPQAKHGRVSSLLSTCRLLGAALGAGLAGAALSGGVTASHVKIALLCGAGICIVGGLSAAASLSSPGAAPAGLDLDVADRAAAEALPLSRRSRR
jgi:MFS family permease